MGRMISVGWLVLVGAGCASPQRLSAKIYAHETRAWHLDESGEHAAATAERKAAERDRERLARGENDMMFARDGQ